MGKWPSAVIGASLLGPFAAGAHHSTAEFNRTVIEEYEGEVQSVFWRNPHVRMTIKVRDAAGKDVLWSMEASDINTLRRLNVSPEVIREGQRVKFAGSPSTRTEHFMLLTHLLLDPTTEVVMAFRTPPRWTTAAIGGGDLRGDPAAASAAADNGVAAGIFRVWSFLATTPPAFSRNPPLTPAAREALAKFDPARDDPVLQCAKPGMPEAMTFIGPHPVQFVDQGDTILLRVESDDVVRTIHMTGEPGNVNEPPSPLGYSTGRWENARTLVVTTTRVSWPFIKVLGLVAVPQSAQSQMVERFTLSEDGTQLSYGFSISDPTTFTTTVSTETYTVWQWLAGAQIQPYECTLER